MAPRSQPLPQAATESAREARKSFFCELCQKGYARMNDFEAHEGSYDHQHRKRLKDLRTLTRDPNATAKARAAERRDQESSGLKTISLAPTSTSNNSGAAGSTPGSGAKSASLLSQQKKKPVFKSTLQAHNAAAVPAATSTSTDLGSGAGDAAGSVGVSDDPSGAVRNGWVAEQYRPRFVTGCEDVMCAACQGGTVDLGSTVGA